MRSWTIIDQFVGGGVPPTVPRAWGRFERLDQACAALRVIAADLGPLEPQLEDAGDGRYRLTVSMDDDARKGRARELTVVEIGSIASIPT